jgi:DNA-binding LacI/PurR family transcriptional regulator
VRALVEHGHRRIVLLARPYRRKPKPGVSEHTFLDALKSEGIVVGDYNLSDWENN